MKKFYTTVLVIITLLTLTASISLAQGVGADCTDPPNLVPFADLVNCDLSGMDLEGINIWSANLTGANLSNTNLSDALLEGVDFTNATATGATFDGADLFAAFLEDGNFDNASLRDTNMEDAQADGASFVNADMRGADLYFANVRVANLSGANFTNTWLNRADFHSSNLQNAVFTGSNLISVDFRETDLRGTDFSFTLLKNSPMHFADLRNATLLGAELDGSNVLEGIIWGNTTCSDGSNSDDDDGDDFTCESNFILNEPPSITLTSPTEDITITLDDTITVSADAADSDGNVDWVEFKASGNTINTDGTAPYSYDWSPPVHGTYVITARAIDNDGDSTTSQSVTVNVVASPNNQPPTVEITSPSNNTTVSRRWGTTIKADANDPDGDFVRVEFYVDDTFLGYDLFPPYRLYWKPNSTGFHTLTAKAIDETGLEAFSDPITVRVR